MSTKKLLRIKKSASDEPEYLIPDPPYTVYGTTIIPTSYVVTMKAGGLRKMLEEFDLKDDDTFRIEIFSGNRAHEYSFIKAKPKKGNNAA